jgi:hypothetical protein
MHIQPTLGRKTGINHSGPFSIRKKDWLYAGIFLFEK